MILNLLAAAIISVTTICDINKESYTNELAGWEDYINYQLKENYSEAHPTVTFTVDIPAKYHDDIRRDAEAARWSVGIELVYQEYSYNNFYKFTFRAM